MANEHKDLINCPAQGYSITRDVCHARRSRGEKRCRHCPENTDQMFLFESPKEIPRKGRKKSSR